MKVKVQWEAIDPVKMKVSGEHIVEGEVLSDIYQKLIDLIISKHPAVLQNISTINIINVEYL